MCCGYANENQAVKAMKKFFKQGYIEASWPEPQYIPTSTISRVVIEEYEE